jgi:predicted Rossmann fold nucleotide-binding protein DprA/Smf involved in DNA uptake
MLEMQLGETYALDQLGAATGLAASELLPLLTELELRGQVVRTSGGRFALASKRV